MYRSVFLSTAAMAATLSLVSPALAQIAGGSSSSVETVVVTAQKLAEARNGIQTQVGASTYTITAKEIDNQPGGENTLLNQVVLQAPGVARGERLYFVYEYQRGRGFARSRPRVTPPMLRDGLDSRPTRPC